MRAAISASVCGALLLASPGLEPYHAWAATLARTAPVRAAPVAVGFGVALSPLDSGPRHALSGAIAELVAPGGSIALVPGVAAHPVAAVGGIVESEAATAAPGLVKAAEPRPAGEVAPAAAILRATAGRLSDDSGGLQHEQILRSVFHAAVVGGAGAELVPLAPSGRERGPGLRAASPGGGDVSPPPSEPPARGRDSGGDWAPRARGLLLAGGAVLAVASLGLFGVPLPGRTLLTLLGLGMLGAAKFYQAPKSTAGNAAPAPAAQAPPRAPGWVERRLPGLLGLWRKAEAALDLHARFEAEVGGGSGPAFRRWLKSGLRAGVYALPVVLAGLFGAAVVAGVPGLIKSGLSITEGRYDDVFSQSWWPLLLRTLTLGLLEQALFLGAFAGVRALLERAGLGDAKAKGYAAALSLALTAAYLAGAGFLFSQALPVLGIQAGLLYAYTRTKTLLVPMVATSIVTGQSAYAGRMLHFIGSKTDASLDALPGIPGAWGVLAVLALAAALFTTVAARRNWAARRWGFLKEAARREWARLRAVGSWWLAPREGAEPRSLIPLLSVGLLWGVGVYLGGYLTYHSVHAVIPTHETIPLVLKKTLLMPFDVLVYIFLLGAALEEWMFRLGLFQGLSKLFARLRARVAPGSGPRAEFRTTAAALLLSALIFSLFHHLDLHALLVRFGATISELMTTLMGVYSFSWAGMLGRVSAGVVLGALYWRTRTFMIPFLAHFASNLLEAVGLRWGLSWFLAGVAALFLFRFATDRSWRRTPSSGTALSLIK